MLVHAIYPTLQGEGSLTGLPIILVRFQGCSAGCSWCDTKPTWSTDSKRWGEEMGVQEIVDKVIDLTVGHQWVLITGGEPLEQDNEDLKALVLTLRKYDYSVALETNGSLPVPGGVFDWVTISPKPQLNLNYGAVRWANEFKYVIGDSGDLPDPLLLPTGVPICLQPMSLSEEATKLCIQTVQERGWRLSLQTHKLVNLP